MIEAIEKAANQEIDILREISVFSKKLESTQTAEERRILSQGIVSLEKRLKAVNAAIPNLLNDITIEEITPAIKMRAAERTEPKEMMKIKSGEKEKMLEELSIKGNLIKRLKRKRETEKGEETGEFKEARGYLKLSNKFFLNTVRDLVKKGNFTGLPAEIRRANMDILSETYISMILFSTFLSIFVALAFVVALLVFGAISLVWLPLIIPPAVFFTLYYYPSLEKNAIAKRIDDELPFAVIHMSSISGSGIAPTEIFKIIGLSKEYPYLRKEIRKILNQINIYGYDLLTALGEVSRSTSSQKLSELLSGLSATISSGGDLSDFFHKRADTLMTEYKLEKEKFIKVAETFMDIYIAVVIAAPMIMMLLLVMISISGIQTGFTPIQLTMITISGVALINILFLVFLQTKQT